MLLANTESVYVYLCVFTLAGNRILCKFITLVTLAEEGPNQVVAVVLTGTLYITFIHIWGKIDILHRVNVQ